MNPQAPRVAANGPMTPQMAQQCGHNCSDCPFAVRRWVRWAALLWLIFAVSIAFAMIATSIPHDTELLCHYEGRTYSVGSLIVVPGNDGRECRASDNIGGAGWFPVKLG